jgi:hypothetical protein
MEVRFWEWMVNERCSAYLAWKQFNGSSVNRMAPGWSFDRFGMSQLTLSDGREMFIGGEHEDYYDRDFYIYNDVVVILPDGGVKIYGYSIEAFPPTDFHSSTLVGEDVVVIGSLGYSDQRQALFTPVFKLDSATLGFERICTLGPCPGWLSKHRAVLDPSGRSITVRGGEIYTREGFTGVRENFDEYRLDLDSWRWDRLTDHRWKQFQARCVGRKTFTISEFHILDSLLPDIQHEKVAPVENDGDEDADAWRSQRIIVQDVTVRYSKNVDSITLTIEGSLPEKVIANLIADLQKKMTTAMNSKCIVEDLNL